MFLEIKYLSFFNLRPRIYVVVFSDLREKHGLVASYMRPDWGSNLQPFDAWDNVQPTDHPARARSGVFIVVESQNWRAPLKEKGGSSKSVPNFDAYGLC